MDLFKLVGKIAIENGEANKEIDATTGKASTASNKMMGAFKKIGGVVAGAFAVDKIKDFGLGCINAASDANAATSQFTQVFGKMEKQASKNLKDIANTAGITENRMKGSYTKIAAFAKTTGADTKTALGIADRAMVAVADSAAFYDRSLEDTTESLQSFLKGNYENDAALGLSCTETTRNAAANKLYGKSFKELSEEQKQLALLQMVEDANKASGAIGQAARESNTWTNVTGNLKQSWTDLQAELGKPILQKVNTFVGNLASKVSGFTQKIKEGGSPVQKFIDKLKTFYNWAKDIGSYIVNTFKPSFDNLKDAFTIIKDAVSPLIEKLKDYVTSGEASKDITDKIKDAIDLLGGVVEIATGLIKDIIQGFKDIYNWGKKNETAVQLIATAFGTLTGAIVAYNIAAAIKNAGGIVELAQLALLQVQLWGLTAAQTVATAATTAFGAAVAFVTSPVTLVIAAIGALIAIGILLYKNWDTISAKAKELGKKVGKFFSEMKDKIVNAVKKAKEKTVEFFSKLATEKINQLKTKAINLFNNIKTSIVDKVNGLKKGAIEKFNALKTGAIEKINSLKSGAVEKVNSLKNSIVEKFNAIKKGITDKIEGAKDKVKNVVDKIKGFFNGMKLKFPKIKMPHFKVTGKFDLKKMTVPKLGIEWYKKAMNNAMVLNSPTVFGYNSATGNFMGGGEAGSEVVAGSQTLMNMIQSAVATQNNDLAYNIQKLIEMLASYFPQILTSMDREIVLDTGATVGALAVPMDEALGRLQIRKDRGR